ncbi:uncharacterized protein LOC120185307 isoform X2 [Hibiscus syriacus]|uniref:uncharacterized protein LOC120185307 isoform X2 n=1 Tax=Hibiscus syriacus TaxID=106335 RepID=UPI001921B400|nr:uncharacterized protein LOC120185307 isoform X2 [Hibiscus syriacus]
MLNSPQGHKQSLQKSMRKVSSGASHKDLWLAVQEGSLPDVDSALALLKKNGSNINSRNSLGLTPLHIATWRNNIPIIRRLLAAGADPDARDGESGWSSLHRALHFGHLAVASVLLQSGASITLEDSKCRTPVDLLSGPVLQVFGSEQDSATEVFSWGSGVNYQLGTGNAHIQKLPCKLDSFHGSKIKLISAAKFHSIAVTARGEVYTWGFGRGGRLGHPDFDIHSGQAAVITPRQVTSGLGAHRVKAIAAAKHHTVIATEGGDVFTWGSNREGQLGYTSVDTQPTPRRVSSLRSRIVAVAAANKHTAVVSTSGEIFTWGCNREGQLGYGTSNSASNYTPRIVEYLKGKFFVGVATAKYHTIVLGADGEVYTWGHRLVTPRRVVITRNLKKSGSTPMKFHRKERLHVVAIAAGMVHSIAMTEDGALFYWVSSDPDLRCQQLYSMCGKEMVSISAGKYWTVVATATGDVYMWDGKQCTDKTPVATRLHGIKRAISVSVGETHLLTIGSLYHPVYPPNMRRIDEEPKLKVNDELEELGEECMFDDSESSSITYVHKNDSEKKPIPSLKSLCEKVAAECLVEPRNAIQLLEIADSLGADDLKKHCEDIVIRNLDYILTVSSQAFATAAPDVLANLEKSLDLRSSESWSYRRLPTPTATFPVIINSEEEDSEGEVLRTRNNKKNKNLLENEGDRSDSFLQPKDDPNVGISKQVRALWKKLQQIEVLEVKQLSGCILDDQQIAKLQTRPAIENSLAEIGVPVERLQLKGSSSFLPDGKGNKKAEVSRKQKRKNKQRVAQDETVSGFSISDKMKSVKDFPDIEIPQVLMSKEENARSEGATANEASEESTFFVQKKESSVPAKDKGTPQTATKKKNRKGGLSMFLSGALDDTPKQVTPPLPSTPHSEGPAWGGAKVSKGSASLREIQDEQSKLQVNQQTGSKTQVEDLSAGKGEGKILLSSFLSSKPIPVVSVQSSQAPDVQKSTPPWASSGAPPHPSRLSLRDIQMQQGKQLQSFSNSPKMKMSGFSVASVQGSPSDSPGMNRWFKPEVEAPSTIRSIQIEERAMKDLKRFYSSVKVVKNQS